MFKWCSLSLKRILMLYMKYPGIDIRLRLFFPISSGTKILAFAKNGELAVRGLNGFDFSRSLFDDRACQDKGLSVMYQHLSHFVTSRLSNYWEKYLSSWKSSDWMMLPLVKRNEKLMGLGLKYKGAKDPEGLPNHKVDPNPKPVVFDL